jgi:hypothetical protein
MLAGSVLKTTPLSLLAELHTFLKHAFIENALGKWLSPFIIIRGLELRQLQKNVS